MSILTRHLHGRSTTQEKSRQNNSSATWTGILMKKGINSAQSNMDWIETISKILRWFVLLTSNTK